MSNSKVKAGDFRYSLTAFSKLNIDPAIVYFKVTCRLHEKKL